MVKPSQGVPNLGRMQGKEQVTASERPGAASIAVPGAVTGDDVLRAI